MPWKELSIVSSRAEFVALASVDGVNLRALCRQFGISAPAGYKWLKRYRQQGTEGLHNASRRPHHSPGETSPKMVALVVRLRTQHRAWGARKLRARLQATGHSEVPSASTIQAILQREGLVTPRDSQKHRAFQRFEHGAANDLWQMDFKGHFALTSGARCHPLTILDDHSRYAVRLAACGNERAETVRRQLVDTFRRYGMPRRMLMDNGSPWAGGGQEPHSTLTIWLLRLGIGVSHGRPLHPQTQGKDERFHRTLKAEVLVWHQFSSLRDCQRRFDPWRDVYNLERPHEALGMQTPASRYHTSTQEYPEQLAPIEYGPGDQVRKVSCEGDISFQGHSIRIGKAFRGYPVALRATTQDGVWSVHFCQHEIGEVTLRTPSTKAAAGGGGFLGGGGRRPPPQNPQKKQKKKKNIIK
jgi:transposase InsO family protein